MAKLKPRPWTAADYEQAAAVYRKRLPLEHFMEAIPAAKQREITLVSLALLKLFCPDVQCFNELLIQYWHQGRIRRVVPDNFVRRCNREPITLQSYALELENVLPLLVMEYVSTGHLRKDYQTNFIRYEQELKVPYYLLFYPELQDLRVHFLEDGAYRRLPVNARGRLAIAELELEVALLDGWVRFWFRGQLLELPAKLQQQLDQERQRAGQERQRAEQEQQRADQEQQRADQEQQRADQEQQQRLQLEAENARLRALVEELQAGR